MGVNSKNTNDAGCGSALLWIIGVLIIIFVAPTIFAWLWDAVKFVFGVFTVLALLCVFGFVIREVLFFFWFVIGIFI